MERVTNMVIAADVIISVPQLLVIWMPWGNRPWVVNLGSGLSSFCSVSHSAQQQISVTVTSTATWCRLQNYVTICWLNPFVSNYNNVTNRSFKRKLWTDISIKIMTYLRKWRRIWRYSSTHSWPRRWVVNFTLRPLYSQRKISWYPLDRMVWAPQPVWTQWWREKFPAPAGIRTPAHTARITALSWLCL
jgi:hypothetical protein